MDLASGVHPALHCIHLLLSHFPSTLPTALTLMVSLSLSLTFLSKFLGSSSLALFSQTGCPQKARQWPRSALTCLLKASQPKKKGGSLHNSSSTKEPSLDSSLVLMSGQAHCDWESGIWKLYRLPKGVGSKGRVSKSEEP